MRIDLQGGTRSQKLLVRPIVNQTLPSGSVLSKLLKAKAIKTMVIRVVPTFERSKPKPSCLTRRSPVGRLPFLRVEKAKHATSRPFAQSYPTPHRNRPHTLPHSTTSTIHQIPLIRASLSSLFTCKPKGLSGKEASRPNPPLLTHPPSPLSHSFSTSEH